MWLYVAGLCIGVWLIIDSLFSIAGLMYDRYQNNRLKKEWTAWKLGRQ